MKYTVIIRPEAENDLNEAFSWYEGKRKGLGYDFLLQVEASLRLIEKNPAIHPQEYKKIRKHLIKRFPYKLIYIIEKEKIIILSFLHAKRNFKLKK